MTKPFFTTQRFWSVPLLALVSAACLAQAPVPDPVTDVETQLGLAVYTEIRNEGQLVATSPLYDTLRPVTEALARATRPQYPHSLKFYILHTPNPNAASTPGGNIYVADSLLSFVRNTEQLAGVLCHELSHTIHLDSQKSMEKQMEIQRRQLGAAILLGPGLAKAIAIELAGNLRHAGYSRDIEARADLDGADICAAAGYNPWGLVWFFEDFQGTQAAQVPQILSDHPDHASRIRALTRHMRNNPAVFARFDPDRRAAHVLVVPKDAPMTFVAPDPPSARAAERR